MKVKFISVVDSKNRKVWINHPLTNEMKLVANAGDNELHYERWEEVIQGIREASPERLNIMMGIVQTLAYEIKNS